MAYFLRIGFLFLFVFSGPTCAVNITYMPNVIRSFAGLNQAMVDYMTAYGWSYTSNGGNLSLASGCDSEAVSRTGQTPSVPSGAVGCKFYLAAGSFFYLAIT